MKAFRFFATAFLFAVFAPGSLFAQSRTQSTDVGIFIVSSALSDTSFIDEGERLNVEFSEKTQYGISVNHFWTEQFSTELALQKIDADLNLSADSLPVTINAGELSGQSVTALGEWHFRRGTRFAPYVGAGLAHISGDFKLNDLLLEPGDPSTIDLESETTWSAAAGANIRLTDRLSLGLEFKYIPWSPTEKGGITDDAIDVDPLTFSTGLRLRF
jgi:outer membrane protein W